MDIFPFFGTKQAETQDRQSETEEMKKTSSCSSSDLTWALCIQLETHQLCQIHRRETITANWNSFPSVSLSLSHTKTGKQELIIGRNALDTTERQDIIIPLSAFAKIV